MKRAILAGLLCLALPAVASVAPTPIKKASRIGTLVYDEDEIYRIPGDYGYQTTIRFERGEVVNRVVVGHQRAWSVTVLPARVVVLQIQPDADTNMAVETNRRLYQFHLVDGGRPFFEVRFKYPVQPVAVAAPASAPAAVALPVAPPRDERFTMQGADELAPHRAWTDGRLIHLDYSVRPHAPIPDVYYVMPDGGESRANVLPMGADRIVRVAGVYRKLVLRMGRTVTCIFHEGGHD